MVDNHYSVVFRGDIVLGKNVLEVKEKLKKLFKVDDSRIDSLFVGKPVPLKKNVSQDEAEKYKAILHQAGIIVVIESSNNVKKTPEVSKPLKADVSTEEKQAPIDAATDTESVSKQWKLAPAGSLLVDEKKKAESENLVEVNVDHLAVLPQGGNLLKDDERQTISTPTIDMDSLDWELTPYGEALLKDAEKRKITPADVDTSELSLASVGVDILQANDKSTPETVDINTDHIHLSPNENS